MQCTSTLCSSWILYVCISELHGDLIHGVNFSDKVKKLPPPPPHSQILCIPTQQILHWILSFRSTGFCNSNAMDFVLSALDLLFPVLGSHVPLRWIFIFQYAELVFPTHSILLFQCTVLDLATYFNAVNLVIPICQILIFYCSGSG